MRYFESTKELISPLNQMRILSKAKRRGKERVLEGEPRKAIHFGHQSRIQGEILVLDVFLSCFPSLLRLKNLSSLPFDGWSKWLMSGEGSLVVRSC